MYSTLKKKGMKIDSKDLQRLRKSNQPCHWNFLSEKMYSGNFPFTTQELNVINMVCKDGIKN